MWGIAAQVIGAVAAVIAVSSFQCKSQKGIVTMQAVSTSMWTVHFFMLGAYSGGLLNLMCAVRSVIYSRRENKKWAQSIGWVYAFTVLSVVIYILQFTVFGKEPTVKNLVLELLPAIGVLATTIGFRLESGFKVRLSQLVSSPVWLVYNFFCFSISGTVTEVIAFSSVIVGIFRHDIKRKKA